jgi:hypothetical protein
MEWRRGMVSCTLNPAVEKLSNMHEASATREGRSEGAMKRVVLRSLVCACALFILGCASGQEMNGGRQAAKGTANQVSTHDVIMMSRAGFADSLVISMIDVTGSRFNLGANDVIALADSGVSHNVINAMIHSGSNAAAGDNPRPVYIYPGYWYYGYPSYAYDPFWYPWYYPGYSINLGFDYRFHGGYGAGRRSFRHYR